MCSMPLELNQENYRIPGQSQVKQFRLAWRGLTNNNVRWPEIFNRSSLLQHIITFSIFTVLYSF